MELFWAAAKLLKKMKQKVSHFEMDFRVCTLLPADNITSERIKGWLKLHASIINFSTKTARTTLMWKNPLFAQSANEEVKD